MMKKIVVLPYNPLWPFLYESEAKKITEALQSNCLDIDHIGSTSVLELAAKPIIDIIVVLKEPKEAIQPLQSLGYHYKGEYNIPFRHYFNKEAETEVHLHVCDEDHPQIQLSLMFRNYLREHSEERKAYGELKANLLTKESSYLKNQWGFTGYNLGKDTFIRHILRKTGYSRLRFTHCSHNEEWEKVKIYRQKYLSDKLLVHDPDGWTFHHPEHLHLVFYEGADIMGYAHLQIRPEKRVGLRMIVIEDNKHSQNFKKEFLTQIKRWLQSHNYKSLSMESFFNDTDNDEKN